MVVELVALAGSLVVAYQTNPGRFLHGEFRASLTLLILCALVAVGGVIVQVVAWMKALSTTRRLGDTMWHNRLLRWGIVGALTTPLLGLGALVCWGVMIAYLRSGPDSLAVSKPGKPSPTQSARGLARTG